MRRRRGEGPAAKEAGNTMPSCAGAPALLGGVADATRATAVVLSAVAHSSSEPQARRLYCITWSRLLTNDIIHVEHGAEVVEPARKPVGQPARKPAQAGRQLNSGQAAAPGRCSEAHCIVGGVCRNTCQTVEKLFPQHRPAQKLSCSARLQRRRLQARSSSADSAGPLTCQRAVAAAAAARRRIICRLGLPKHHHPGACGRAAVAGYVYLALRP